MSDALVIRPLGRDQVVRSVDRFVAVARDVAGEYWSSQHFLLDLPDKWLLSLAAWRGEALVGYAILSRKSPDTAHLHHFMVATDQRGRGLGSRLIAAAVERCRQNGCVEMSLKVAAGSAGAQRFYRQHRFENTGRDGNYSTMRRRLTFTVAIHQPNYAPWLGYFAKMAQADVFVFLDDVQYSKNSYINRVQIDAAGSPRWLTVPVSYNFGNPINQVRHTSETWRKAHLDTLKTYYAEAPSFGVVWNWLDGVLAAPGADDLAASNESLIRGIAERLKLRCTFRRSSEFDIGSSAGDDRLIAILQTFGPDVTYVSGKGGSQYQDPAKFERAGIRLLYSDFVHPTYDQGHDFIAGLSILDGLFRVGWERTAEFVGVPAAS